MARFLVDHGAPAPDGGLTPSALGLAALVLRPEITEGRAAVAAAVAGEVTAGTRPFPSGGATIQTSSPSDRQSPWTLAVTTGLTYETGGKREARLARARAVTLASSLRLQATAWLVAQDARQAAVRTIAAEHGRTDAEAEAAGLRDLLELLRGRYAEGRVSIADVAQAEADVQGAALSTAQTRREVADARSALARALGVPVRIIDATPLRDDGVSACGVADDGRPDPHGDTLTASALRARYEVGAVLADYAVAEMDVRVQLAGQYPDLTLGPGISWDQGVGRWLLSIGSAAIPLNRNRGPIGEAEARRRQQAVRVETVEDSVLAQVDSARNGCRALDREMAVVDSLVAATNERVRVVEAAYTRGEIGQTEVAVARLALVRAERARHQALDRRAAAGATLEAAIGRWITQPGLRWPDLFTPPANVTPADQHRDQHE